MSVHLASCPTKPISFLNEHVIPFYWFGFNDENPLVSQTQELAREAIRRAPILADVIFQKIQMSWSPDAQSLAESIDHIVKNPYLAETLALACCDFASYQACLEMHQFLQKQNTYSCEVLTARVCQINQINLNRSLKKDPELAQKMASSSKPKPSKI